MKHLFTLATATILSVTGFTAQAQWSSQTDAAAAQVQQILVNQHGFDPAYVDSVLLQATYKSSVMDILNRTPAPSSEPSPGTWTRYRNKFLTQDRISSGAQFWRDNVNMLKQAQAQYGVPIEYIVAILGVESGYGKITGEMRVIDALATGAFNHHRRQDLYQQELVELFIWCRENGIDPLSPIGNYAGAMGYGQFLPSSVRKYAVDGNGDGQRTITQVDDAILSVAHYFQQHGWQTGESYTVPASFSGNGYQALTFGWRGNYTAEQLGAAGVSYPAGLQISDGLSLIRLRHSDYDQFLIGGRNFYAVTRYNNSTRYAMAVHELAQAIKDAR